MPLASPPSSTSAALDIAAFGSNTSNSSDKEKDKGGERGIKLFSGLKSTGEAHAINHVVIPYS